MEMEYRISGIPCIIRVCDIDDEYVDWEVLDRKGYVAYWLAAKLSLKDEMDITNALIAEMKNAH